MKLSQNVRDNELARVADRQKNGRLIAESTARMANWIRRSSLNASSERVETGRASVLLCASAPAPRPRSGKLWLVEDSEVRGAPADRDGRDVRQRLAHDARLVSGEAGA